MEISFYGEALEYDQSIDAVCYDGIWYDLKSKHAVEYLRKKIGSDHKGGFFAVGDMFLSEKDEGG